MVSKSSRKVIKDRRNKDNSNNAANDKENRHTLSSRIIASSEYDSNVELLDVDEVVHQHNNSNTRTTVAEPRTKVLFDKANEKKLSRSSEVWKYAVRGHNSNYATCCLCDDHTRISTNNGSTSTLRRHLILKHNKHELVLPTAKRRRAQSSIDRIRKQQLHNLSIGCIIRDSRTFNDLTKPGIRRLLQEVVPGYDPPNRYTVIHRLKRLHAFHHKKLIEDLRNVVNISITIDLWSNKQMRSFLVITGHYFPADSYDLRSTILNFSTFDKQHTSAEISRTLEVKLKELNILQKFTHVTCDGGRNVVSAIDNMNFNVKRVWCVAHRLHLTITNSLGFWKMKKEDNEDNTMNEETDSIHDIDGQEKDLIDIDEFEDSHDMDMDIINDSELEDNQPMDATDLNDDEELLSDIMDEEIIDNWTEDVNESCADIIMDQEMIVCLLKKCRGLISKVKRSTTLALFFDNERKKLNIKRSLSYDVKSRWNSTFTMIDSLLVLREIIERLFNYKNYLLLKPKQRENLARYELTNDEWNLLSDLHFVLKPFFHATTVMSGSQYPSIGLALYLITRLKHFLQRHEAKQNLIIKRLKQLLLAKLLFYFEHDYEQMQLLKMHAYFDPAGFSALSDPEKRLIEQNIKILAANETLETTEAAATALPNTTTAMKMSNKVNRHEKSSRTAMDMFNESIGELTQETTCDPNKKSTIIDDIRSYRTYAAQFNLKHKPDASSSTVFWKIYGKHFSILGKLANKMLNVPATSVPSESCFSVSNFIGRKERTRLTGENLSSSVFLKDKIDT
ncbi:unnamed protein product [Rotaria magnacalcarata]|uniref:BED-type domain-containing protein n=1 Tax=Rotaria magnacalcarata TaxID=392030 RepID=A0A815ATL4_9BILA|nr:unnamed protein product [Rotaria magnacalcarata]CAF2136721.1 unnamed protein product [Rotaria magnacalcarata]CAF4010099.1 unnamed protein product [Rotaria magnacalcarata]CAF4030009.1 unnamed protein product [Rotaria magnacalcarata]